MSTLRYEEPMLERSQASCGECGNPLSAEPWANGLCLCCLAELAEEGSPVDGEGPPSLAAAADATAPGSVLGDRYQLRSYLGCGGMSEVWLAFDLKLRVDVALKSLRPELSSDPRALESLHQEVRLAREVISPNVYRVFDLQELGGKEWISMEHVDGRSLAQILEDRGPLDLDEAGEVAAQLLAGLEAIHDAGLVHRDLKPENVMVTRAGRVVVMDLGIAVATDACPGMAWNLEIQRSLSIVGTPAYMSPEQTRGEALDARADVFSAGLVLAEMVAPAQIGARAGPQRVLEAIRAQNPENAETPWAPVIARAVAFDREQRFASAAALARALEEVGLSDGETTETPARGASHEAPGRAERRGDLQRTVCPARFPVRRRRGQGL